MRTPRTLPPATLRWRLTALYGGLFLAAGIVLLATTYLLLSRQLEHRAVHAPDPPGEVTADGMREWHGLDGLDALEELGDDLGLDVDLDLGDGGGAGAGGTPGGGQRLAVANLLTDALDGQRKEALNELLTQSAIALAVVAVVAGGLGWVVAGRALRPLRDITATARRLSTDNLDERIALSGPPGELTELADTFDAMLARLSAAFDAQRRFVANASHELRTPLAVQRAAVDVALADPDPTVESLTVMATRVRAATERHERVIGSLLALARSQTGIERYEDVDLAAVAATAWPDAAARGLRFTPRLDPAPLRGDRILLERLAANLVDNGVRYNEDGGWLTVETSSDAASGTVTLRVANSGPRVPPERVAELFQPFRRLGDARTGTGLGLSIVAAIAQAHHGTCAARALPEGGLEIAVRLPPAPLTA
ncbi:sensor histidine kinase [Streptomyces sp. 6N223]|uniref:sensor histidine kinase n=1 Tax=Streptomyces sp. 6N223 TaxID=3457412 RepID=UPI003FCF8AA5